MPVAAAQPGGSSLHQVQKRSLEVHFEADGVQGGEHAHYGLMKSCRPIVDRHADHDGINADGTAEVSADGAHEDVGE